MNNGALGTTSAASMGQMAAGAGGSADMGGVADAAVPKSTITPAQARVVKTASLEVSVRTNALVTDATAQANHIAEANGGYVASSDSFKGKNRQTTLTLRVPAAAYDDALRQLRRLGKVTDESLGGKDVTGTLVDLDARLRTLRAQEDALNALLAKARTVGETLQVTQAASEVRMQVEQLAAQQAQLSDQADFSTIKLHIVGPHVAFDAVPRTDPLLVTSLRHAVAGTLAVFGGVIVVVGYLLPVAALGALGYFGRRLTSGRRVAASPQ
jgi:flagellar capping protein FliD